ncbi:MAG: PRC-barrel domain-containing protein [Acidobacteria bacterium]|nr:PRC-barrel domain-containing protein [Acidobacteriota bacterium]MBI3487204.1 PRC-barrel domain-containing protein [Acidobacteriota bacterium]
MSQLALFSNCPVKASSIIGTKVVDTAGEGLGNIKEIVIDPRTGRVAYVVMAFGGFLHMGEKLFAIPFSSFAFDEANSQYSLKVPKERLEKAPGFDSDHWPSMSDEQWNRDLHTYYGYAPYWE